jgi:transposase
MRASPSPPSSEQDNTVIAVIEMSQSKWLVAAVVPGVKRQPLKKLQADEEALLKWKDGRSPSVGEQSLGDLP